jgi:hypothetical protein
MISHTQAFKRLKDSVQDIFNFAIVVCHAVPSLKKHLGQGPLDFTADYFVKRPIPLEHVKKSVTDYKEILSRHIFIGSFSFFESYFVDVLQEIVDFHGKDEILKKHDIVHNKKFEVLKAPSEIVKAQRNLRDFRSAKDKDRYVRAWEILERAKFVFPSSVLARHGLKELIKTIEGGEIKAREIPGLTESVLQLRLEDKEKDEFHCFREMRNRVPSHEHGPSFRHLNPT